MDKYINECSQKSFFSQNELTKKRKNVCTSEFFQGSYPRGSWMFDPFGTSNDVLFRNNSIAEDTFYSNKGDFFTHRESFP